MPKDKGIPRYVAIHEAGHAVVSWAMQRALGRHYSQFSEIVLRTPAEIVAGPMIDRRGRSRHASAMVEQSDRYTPFGPEHLAQLAEYFPLEEIRASMEADVIDTLAGPIAEARWRHASRGIIFMFYGTDDWEIANRKVRDFVPDDADRSRLMAELERRSAMLVRKHWQAIVALADALLIRKRMDASEALAVIEGVAQLGPDEGQSAP